VIELARRGTKVAQPAEAFGMSEAAIYAWLKIDRGEIGIRPAKRASGQETKAIDNGGHA
jgi:predicted transcriptional regulator